MSSYRLRFAGTYHRQPVEVWSFERMCRFFSDQQLEELSTAGTTYLPDDTFVQLLSHEEDDQ